jgi:hypothetical protein
MTTTGGPVNPLIVKLAEETEVHPAELVIVKLYVPGARPEIVFVVPLPGIAIFPGLRVNVQEPVAGNPVSITLPVGRSERG